MKTLFLFFSISVFQLVSVFGQSLLDPAFLASLNRTVTTAAAITNVPVAYWAMDEPSTGVAPSSRIDSIGTNTLTDINNTVSATGIKGNAADFEFSNDNYLQAGDNPDLDFHGIQPFTFTCWVNMESQSSVRMILSKYQTTGNQLQYNIRYVTSTNRFSFVISSDGSDNKVVQANSLGAVSLFTWYFIAAGFDGSSIWIRVNGGSRDTVAASSVFNSTAKFVIGGREGGNDLFDGLIDEVKAWNVSLSDAELDALYNGGTPL